MKILTKKIFIISLIFSVMSTPLIADDVDIFTKSSTEEANVLFIMDNSGSMEGRVPGTNKTRMEVMQNALKSVLRTAPDYLSIGIMNYGSEKAVEKSWRLGGVFPNGVQFPIKPVNALARPIIEESITMDGNTRWRMSTLPVPNSTVKVKEYIGQISDNWEPGGWTPIVDSLYEAALYYRGEKIKFGYEAGDEVYAAHPSTYVRHNENPNLDVPYIITDEIHDPSICNSVRNIAISKFGSVDDIKNWDEGRTNGELCPADRFNPVGPGTKENCAATKHDCTSRIVNGCLEYNSTDNSNCGLEACSPGGLSCKIWGNNTEVIKTCLYSKCKRAYRPAPKYISPITGDCKSNNIILMSDGVPDMGPTYPNPLTSLRTHRTTPILGNNDGIETIMGEANKTNCRDNGISNIPAGKCGPELTHYLASHDNTPTITGDQFIDTLVIGFSSGISEKATVYLKSLVTIADDTTTPNREGYYAAQNEIQLADAFNKALLAIKTKAENTYDRATYSSVSSISLTHDKYAYVAVFEDSGGAVWNGNLKKYEVIDSKLYGLNATGAKTRATTSSGAFVKDVKDLWATGTPSGKVTDGGAANKITPSSRNVLTNNNNSTVNINTVTKSQLGVTSNSDKDKLLSFIKGSKSDGSARHHMGDIIHSQPVQLITSSTESVIFTSTNEGFVHAIQASTGEELFAFMPDVLLPKIKEQMTGSASPEHLYGVDGQITLWHDDTNFNGIKEDTEKAYIYFGLRRGGLAYYALDVTTPASPELLWVKKRDLTNTNKTSSGYENLGFTWSTPKVENLRYETSSVSLIARPIPVLIFGGGYINDKIAPPSSINAGGLMGGLMGGFGNNNRTTTTNPTNMGEGVYIVNATTGDVLESYTHADMGEVPGEVRAIDTDRNGSIDRLYFADTKANVWRVDLNKDSDEPYNLSKDKSEKITKFAELGGSGENKRSFFSGPDVAIFKHHGKPAISVSVGSGMRPDPLNNDINDYFFMLLDENVYNAPPANHPAITLTDLLNAPVTSIDLVDELKKPGSSKGWKKKLDSADEGTGEKVLSTALTYQNKILFTTFSAEPFDISNTSVLLGNATSNACASTTNTNKLYALDILTGGAALDLDSASDNTNDDWVAIGSGKLPTTPQIRYNSYTKKGGGTCTGDDCVRNQNIHAADTVISLDPDTSLPRIYWRVKDN